MMSEPQTASHWASTGVESLALTVRAYNCLLDAGITSLGELVKKTPDELLAVRALGRKSLQVIQDELAIRGLHLGMKDIDVHTCESMDAFLEAMELVRCLGISTVADLVTKTPREVEALPGVDASALRHIEDGLAQWNLSLGMRPARQRPTRQARPNGSPAGGTSDIDQVSSAKEVGIGSSRATEATRVSFVVPASVNGRATDRASEQRFVRQEDPPTVRDELLCAVANLLAGSKSKQFRCFAAYYSIDGCATRTLQEIGERGLEYGLEQPVSRERVRQLIANAERLLRGSAGHTKFAHWPRAVLAARERVPTTVANAVDVFGYGSCEEPSSVFSMLRLVANIFSLEFPFDIRVIRGTDVVIDRSTASVETTKIVDDLTRASGESYYETSVEAARIGCEMDILEKVITAGFGWEFLDEAHRYFWKRPRLPPRDYAVTGNAILTGLCKVFSVAREANVVDLAQAVWRQRGVRTKVPQEVVESIAARSGLFDLEQGLLRRKAGQAWFCLGERDLNLLRVFVQRGRVLSSQILYSSLVRHGLTSGNAGVVIACSPFLVHTKAGKFLDEGVYKLVCRTDDVVTALEERTRSNGAAEQPCPHPMASNRSLRIAVSSRVRLSGVHFAPEPIEMDGEWRVRSVDGSMIGVVSLSDHLVKGLCSVVEALGLETNAVLELRRLDCGDFLAVRA